MPIVLRRKDGSLTPFRNIEYLPFYYFIPQSFLACCGEELNSLPRNPQQLVMNRAACEIVESDLFLLLIIDAAAYMVWPHMGFSEYMEIYSGYDPACHRKVLRAGLSATSRPRTIRRCCL